MTTRLLVAIVQSILGAVYWWIVFTTVYADALFAGDRDPAQPPLADRAVLTRSGIIIVAAVAAYALLIVAFERLTRSVGARNDK